MNQRESNEYALQKTGEYFESLTWEKVRESAEMNSDDGLKVAMVISELGDQLEAKMGITPQQFSQMLLAAGAAIGAALKENRDHKRKRASWN